MMGVKDKLADVWEKPQLFGINQLHLRKGDFFKKTNLKTNV